MKRAPALAALLLCSGSLSCAAPVNTISNGRFGTISVLRGSAEPRDVVLFLSGDGGWNLGVISKKVGHGYSVERNWLPQFEAAYDRITAERF